MIVVYDRDTDSCSIISSCLLANGLRCNSTISECRATISSSRYPTSAAYSKRHSLVCTERITLCACLCTNTIKVTGQCPTFVNALAFSSFSCQVCSIFSEASNVRSADWSHRSLAVICNYIIYMYINCSSRLPSTYRCQYASAWCTAQGHAEYWS